MDDSLKKLIRGFVFNDVDPELIGEPRNLGFGWTLRRATSDELNNPQLRWRLKSYAQLRGYEHGVPVVLQDVQRKSETWVINEHRLTEVQMHEVSRVSVLESNGAPQISPWHLREALALADAELKIGCFLEPDINPHNMSFWWEYSGFRMNTFRPNDGELHEKRASVGDLTDLIETVKYMAENDIQDEIRRAIRLFMSLDAIPDDANMKRLGYFTVLEALLSHAPKSNDAADSIQRQLSRNLILIDNRLKDVERRLGFENFGDMKPENLIRKLYSYRSNIAHGGTGVKELVNLYEAVCDPAPWQSPSNDNDNPDPEWQGKWLRRLVRRVLFSAIREPQLITDLK